MASETSSQQTRYDPWISQQQQGTAGTAYGMANQFWQASPFARAAQTADQLKAFDFARQSTGNVFDAPRQNVLDLESARPLYTPQLSGSGKVTAGLISEQMNPFLNQVGGAALDAGRREYLNADAGLAAKYAAAGAMGGSGEAIARGQAARGFNQDSMQTIAGIQGAGYDKAGQMALANEGMAQQMAGKNMDAINSMRLSALDYGLKSPQVQSQLDTQRQARELQGAQAVLGAGNQQQQFAQSAMDVPRTMLDWYRNYVPQVYNQDTFKQTEKDDGGSGLLNGVLGLGSSLIGAAGKAGGFGALFGGGAGAAGGAGGLGALASVLPFSDETLKTDIKKVGRDEDTGLMVYSYRYKGDPKTYPKMSGPMAQEVEKEYPGTTKRVGGKLAIDVGLLSDALRSAKKAA